MIIEEVIPFGIAFLFGALVTALCIVAIVYMAKGVEKILFSESQKKLRESRAYWMKYCGTLEEHNSSLKKMLNTSIELTSSVVEKAERIKLNSEKCKEHKQSLVLEKEKLANDFMFLTNQYTDLSKKFNENTIKRLKLIDENEELKDLAESEMNLKIDYSREVVKLKKELDRGRKNLSPKYNPNVTRGVDGRYKSLK